MQTLSTESPRGLTRLKRTGRRAAAGRGALLVLALFVGGPVPVLADEPPATPPAAAEPTYEAVQAVFQQHCAACHAGGEAEGGLKLDSYETLLAGGEHGAVLVPGQSASSRLVLVLTGQQEPRMPPEGNEPPSAEELALVTAWIDAGAKGPSGAPPDPTLLVTPRMEPRVAPRRPITAVAWSPDGKQVALAVPGEVRLLDAAHRGLLRRLTGQRGAVNDLAWSADGKRLAAAAGEPGVFGEVRVWDPTTGSLERVITTHRDAIYALALSPDGQRLATGSYDQELQLWNLGSGQLERAITGHNGAIYDLAFRPDGQLLASASADRTVKLWDLATGERRDTLGQAQKELYCLAFSPDGTRIAAGGVDSRIRVWQLSPTAAEGTNPLLVSKVAHQGAILQLAWSSDGQQLVSAAEDRVIRVWKAGEVQELRALEPQSDWPGGLALAPDGKQLLVGRLDGGWQLYLTATGKPAPLPVPQLTTLAPRGVTRGAATRLRLTGQALFEVTQVEAPASLAARVLGSSDPNSAPGGEEPSGQEWWIEVTPAADFDPGPVELAVVTPAGTSGKLKLYVDELPQVVESEPTSSPAGGNAAVSNGNAGGPNGSVAAPQELTLPVGVWGTLATPGDSDRYHFAAEAGQTVVCEVAARALGSKADTVLTLFDAQGRLVASNNDFEGQEDPLLAVQIPTSGSYTLEVSELVLAGSSEHFYRLSVGTFAYVTGVYPLAVAPGQESSVDLAGYNLPAPASLTVRAGKAAELPLPVPRSQYRLRRPLKLLVADPAGTRETEPNDTPAEAMTLAAPATVEARAWRPEGTTGATVSAGSPPESGLEEDVDLFRFESRRGETWIVETTAAERGSPIDTQLEVLDAEGRPVPRLNLVALRDSQITFRGITSLAVDVRLTNWEEMELNQFVYFQGEVSRLFRLPQGPDSGFLLYGWQGKRIGYFDTSPTAHAVDEPAYIVEARPIGLPVAATGLPVIPLYYGNDDDGDRRRERDSRLTFTAPADGSYLVRVRDVRGLAGDQFAYRLAIRRPQPDFVVRVEGANPSIPAGTAKVLPITVERRDGFDGPVTVELTGAPEGFTLTSPVVVEAGHFEASALLYAAPDAPEPSDDAAKANRISARADVAGSPVTKSITPLGNIRRAPPGKLRVLLEPAELTIAPGQTITARLRIERNGFEGLVNFSVANLPHGVYVDNIGLNGVLIPENESEREIFFTARPWVGDSTRQVAAVATSAGGVASAPITFHVRGPQNVAQK